MEFFVSVFTAGSVVGYIAEMLWCLLTHHVLESRQGMLFGPFSQVYGIGAVLLTLLISRTASKKRIFAVSAVVGGAYEYVCSYIQERLFGTISWDYGDGIFSIGGRTSILFCVFWGLMGIMLIRRVNPWLRRILEKHMSAAATVLSAVVAVFFILNLQLSYMAVKRQSDRRDNRPPADLTEQWLDESFPDDVLKRIYPNMVVCET